MRDIDKKAAPVQHEIDAFLTNIEFSLPQGFLDFFKQANGAIITSEKGYADLWPLTEMVELNKDYGVEEFAPEFFIFGSDGGDTAYAIERATGDIYEMPFIGMSKEEAVFRSKTFTQFLADLD
jgi:hypothetical protein